MKKHEIPEDIKEAVVSLHNDKMSYRDIVIKITDKFHALVWNTFNFHDVKFIIDGLKKDTGKIREQLRELDETMESTSPYEVTEDHYIFSQKRPNQDIWEIEINKFPILISTVDAIFKDYSKHWNNLSWEEILQKYNIKIELFNIIKNRLRLFKSSHVVSPVTLDRASDEELQGIIDWAIIEHRDDRYRKRFVESFEKDREKDYVEKSRKIANIDYRLEVISKFLDGYKPRELSITVPNITNNEEVTVLFGDLHIGKQETDKVLNRLEKMTQDLVNRPERKVNLICLGDLFETIAKGWMHPWQIESMDWLYWFKLFEKVISIFETMLFSLYRAGKEVKFFGLGWNHDRMTEKKEDGFAWIAALMVYTVIQKSLQNIAVEINLLRDIWNVVDIQWFRYILHHWDDGANKKKPSQILWELGDKSKPNIIAMADKHHKEEHDPNSDAIHMLIPWMAGSNEYDKRLLLSSYPWYVCVFKDYVDWTPQTFTRRFND